MKNYLDNIIIKPNLSLSILLIFLFCISNVLNIISLLFIFYSKFNIEIKLFLIFIITQILISIAFILGIIFFITMVIYLIFRIKKYDVSLKILFSCISFSIFPLIIFNVLWGIFMAYNYTNIDIHSLSFIEFSIKISNYTIRVANMGIYKILKYFFYLSSVLILGLLIKKYKLMLQENKNEITY